MELSRNDMMPDTLKFNQNSFTQLKGNSHSEIHLRKLVLLFLLSLIFDSLIVHLSLVLLHCVVVIGTIVALLHPVLMFGPSHLSIYNTLVCLLL